MPLGIYSLGRYLQWLSIVAIKYYIYTIVFFIMPLLIGLGYNSFIFSFE